MNGLHGSIAKELRAMSNVECCGVEDILCRAKVLITSMKFENIGTGAIHRDSRMVDRT